MNHLSQIAKSVSARFLVPLLLPFLSASAYATSLDDFSLSYLQILLGQLEAEESWTIEDDNGDELIADRDDLFYIGVLAHSSAGAGIFEYGVESGGFASFANDTSVFVRSNGGTQARVNIKNELWLLDFSFGGFISLHPTDWFRVYASVGPAFTVGSISIENDDVTIDQSPTNQNTIVIDTSTRETDFDAGIYGRVGAEFLFSNKFALGVSARHVDTTLDFDNSGVLTFDNTQVFITVGKSY